jgi:hypothetical protein
MFRSTRWSRLKKIKDILDASIDPPRTDLENAVIKKVKDLVEKERGEISDIELTETAPKGQIEENKSGD